MTTAIAFRKKIVIDTNRNVSKQIGMAQRGQWLFINGMNARLMNRVGNILVVVLFDRRHKTKHIVQYA